MVDEFDFDPPADIEPPGRRWRVQMRSRSGMWTHYDGHVDVVASNPSDAVKRALDQLSGPGCSFSDRPRDAWVIEGITPRDAP